MFVSSKKIQYECSINTRKTIVHYKTKNNI